MSKRFPIGSDNWKRSGPSGKRKPKDWYPQFTAIDGEGYTDAEGNHRYFLLACSDGSYISESGGLSTVQCIEYLFDISLRNPHTVLVCYGASYDINMMFHGVSEYTAEFIYKSGGPFFLDGHRYWIRYTPKKMLILSRWVNDKRQSLTLYDCIGFFQQSFVQALEDWLGKDYPSLPQIKAGKERRSQFNLSEFDSILSYCQAELAALVPLMEAVRDSLKQASIKISQWYGPGAIASSLLKQYNMKQHMRDTYHENRDVYTAAQHAFAGGRIELIQYGYYQESIYHYDINSAYPSIIAELPSMASIEWQHSDMPSDWHTIVVDFALYHIKWQRTEDDDRFYPFHYRTPYGGIYFPAYGEGWYWGVEVNAALQCFSGKIEFLECYWPKYSERIYPFKWVKELYEKRKKLKAEGNAAHKTIKLGLNSLYGKLIQHVGGNKEKDKLPAFHQLEWAGYITAATRAKLYSVGMQHQEAIIGFQTDGIFSTEPLDLDLGDNLGQWTEEEQCSKGLFVQSGIYWIWEQDSGREISHYRGFDSGSLSAETIIQAYKHEIFSVTAPSTRFVTMGGALAQDFSQWCTWRTIDRELNLLPFGTKRIDDERIEHHPGDGLVVTLPAELFARSDGAFGISAPYELPWEKWESEVTVDGVLQMTYEEEYEQTYL